MSDQQEFKGRIFADPISMQAWGIATRLVGVTNPTDTTEIKEQRLGYAIAAQMGMNAISPPSKEHTKLEASLLRKLTEIQKILID